MLNIAVRKAEKVNGNLSAFCKFDYDAELVDIMRSMPSRFWHADKKEWEISANRLVTLLNKIGSKHQVNIVGNYMAAALQQRATEIPEGFKFKTNPFEHQMEGFLHGLKNDWFLLADEQGLGKTKQVIDNAVARKVSKGYKHCLVICAVNGTKWNWQKEVGIHSDEKSWLLGTRFTRKGKPVVGSNLDKLNDLQAIEDGKFEDTYFIITNIESLRYSRQVETGKNGRKKTIFPIQEKISRMCDEGIINMVIVDEIHKCKNPTSQQGAALLKVQPECGVALSGTPLLNSPLDLYIILKWLQFEKHSFWQFKNHYCVYGGFGGKEIQGYKNLGELYENLESLMLRRLKKDVTDLPDKVYITEYVEMGKEQASVYNEVMAEIQAQIDRIRLSNNPLAQLIRLRQATGYTGILSSKTKVSAKLDRLEELVEEAVANGDKVIVFSNFTDMTAPAYERLAKYNPAIITGEVKDRKGQEEKFMEDDSCKVIVGTIGAMGTGLTLTAATTVIFLDEPWNRATKEQAEDRAHRIGTTSTVTIITLITKDTIDERIADIVQQKGKMADVLVDGIHPAVNRADLVDFLLGEGGNLDAANL